VLLVDCDAHQGNGVQRDKQYFKDTDLCILDMYNARAFPLDQPAKEAIDIKVRGA
jgi:acetoin utilization deacetylase AcuC-like enzyme